MKESQYRVIKFDTSNGPRFVALAWNYEEAVLIATQDHASYTEARTALGHEANRRNVELKWFDGSYNYNRNNGQIESE